MFASAFDNLATTTPNPSPPAGGEPAVSAPLSRPTRQTATLPRPIGAAADQQAQLRLSLMRSLAPFVNDWRDCSARVCRRYRRCASPALECETLAAPKPRSPAQDAALLASLQRAIKGRAAELARARTGGAEEKCAEEKCAEE
ncbi:MAG TPA: hypothetical protein VMH84_00850 [Xanthobacteraceae bacterium]|nr:hypothetical protein [Xanthobacteraceae bacterium]